MLPAAEEKEISAPRIRSEQESMRLKSFMYGAALSFQAFSSRNSSSSSLPV